MLKYLALLSSLAFGQSGDCDFGFTIRNTLDVVQFNNKQRVCVNWQISYFSSGFSAVSLQFESATDAGNVPGTFTIFAGTLLAGSNPMSAIDRATSTFGGSLAEAWVRINPITLTGTGQITGRAVGNRLTARSNFGQSSLFQAGIAAFLGNATLPIDSQFVWFAQGAATRTVNSNGSIFIQIPQGNAANAVSYRCVALPTYPAAYTWTIAWMPYINFNNAAAVMGAALYNSGTNLFDSVAWQANTSNTFPTFALVKACTSTFSCTGVTSNYVGDHNIIWQRAQDDGTNISWTFSADGVNFPLATATHRYAHTVLQATHACFVMYTNTAQFEGGDVISWSITTP